MKVELLSPSVIDESPIWLVCIGNVLLGINCNHQWCIDVNGKERLMLTPDDTMPILPLLEVGRGRFFEHLRLFESERGNSLGLVESFPTSLLLRFAFESSFSEYWPLKALDWIDGEQAIDPKVRESLRRMSEQRWVTQKLKQIVKKKMGKIKID
ncbi:hypothetical protein [Burkholderia sp. ABCPW 11]|uniref:hypothetical protein n=1 Tax=Burkholderia sp. ABCPW 11 TaxID=1637859 RepID=UPI0012FD087E|nr:hypothetical protein [Burkholderia sp. ABCPW 11]